MSQFIQRVFRAVRLDATLYQELRDDPSALGQAMGVIVLQGLAGSAHLLRESGPQAMAMSVVIGLGVWLLNAFLICLLGGRVFGTDGPPVRFRAILRPLGFAGAPGLFYAFSGVLPQQARIFVSIGLNLWLAAAAVLATREGLRVGTRRAVVVYALSLALLLIVTGGIVLGMTLLLRQFAP